MLSGKKILVLDVEGTLIPTYDFAADEDVNGHYPAIIDQKDIEGNNLHTPIKDLLANLTHKDWTIVLATGTDGDNIAYYQQEFNKAGFEIKNEYTKPINHNPADSKADKLNKWADQFGVEKSQIYFYDDARVNVEAAIAAGYTNAKRVNDANPLAAQLQVLVQEEELLIEASNRDKLELGINFIADHMFTISRDSAANFIKLAGFQPPLEPIKIREKFADAFVINAATEEFYACTMTLYYLFNGEKNDAADKKLKETTGIDLKYSSDAHRKTLGENAYTISKGVRTRLDDTLLRAEYSATQQQELFESYASPKN
jgi:HAD superfamily phosphatase (TIGR01681 family)